MAAGDRILAGTDSGLFRVAMDGTGWARAGQGLTGHSINQILAHESALFAATSSGLFVSKDNGGQWLAGGNGIEGGQVRSLGAHGGVLYAGTDWHGLFRSTDGGATWSAKNEGYPYRYANKVVRSGSSTLAIASFLGGNSLGFRSPDEGVTWKIILPGKEIAALNAKGPDVFVLTVTGELLRSRDEGVTWVPGPAVAGIKPQRNYTLSMLPGWLFVKTDSAVFRSKDGVSPWEKMETGLPAKSVHWLIVSGTHLYAKTDSVMVRSLDAGLTWKPADPILTATALPRCAIGPYHLAVGSKSLMRSEDDGAGWKRIELADTLFSNAIAVGRTFLVSTYGGDLFRSSDYGLTWTKYLMEVGWKGIGDMAAGEKYLFATTGDNGVRRRLWTDIAVALAPGHEKPEGSGKLGFLSSGNAWMGPSGKVDFFLPSGMMGVLTLHDASGRKERVLWKGRSEGGKAEASPEWRRVDPGIHFLRLEAGREVRYRKLMIDPG
jgi:hypothetical protein